MHGPCGTPHGGADRGVGVTGDLAQALGAKTGHRGEDVQGPVDGRELLQPAQDPAAVFVMAATGERSGRPGLRHIGCGGWTHVEREALPQVAVQLHADRTLDDEAWNRVDQGVLKGLPRRLLVGLVCKDRRTDRPQSGLVRGHEVGACRLAATTRLAQQSNLGESDALDVGSQ